MALTTTPQTKNESGTFTINGKTYSYGGDLVASTTQVRGSVSSGLNTNLLVRVTAESIKYKGNTLINTKVDAITDRSLSLYVDNIFTSGTSTITANIKEASGNYGIGGISFELKIE